MKKNVIIDCDPGIDDALALLLAFASSELDIKAVTTVRGNVGVEQATKNLLSIIELSKIKKLPATGSGSSLSFIGKDNDCSARGVHGKDGLGNSNFTRPRISLTHKNGIELIISKLLTEEADTLICLGPLTNIAQALTKTAEVKDKIKQIVVMGGAVYSAGNVTKAAEFNILADPEAADVVFRSGLTIDLVALDVTQKTIFTEDNLKRLNGLRNHLGDFVRRIAEYSIDFHKINRGINGCFIHDALAVAVTFDESLGQLEHLCLGIDLDKQRGKTYIKEGLPNVRFYKSINSDKFLSMFLERLTNIIQDSEKT